LLKETLQDPPSPAAEATSSKPHKTGAFRMEITGSLYFWNVDLLSFTPTLFSTPEKPG
jgi:hypothetical protein